MGGMSVGEKGFERRCNQRGQGGRGDLTGGGSNGGHECGGERI